MKNIFVIPGLILAVAVSSPVCAQDTDLRKEVIHQFAIKGGQNSSWINFKPTVPQNPTKGIILGVSYSYMAQGPAGILLELLYTQSGWAETSETPDLYYSRSLTYLELPVLSNFVIGKKRNHFKLQLGPKIAYLLNESERTNVDTAQARYYYGREVEDTIELGLAFGASVSHLFSFGEMQVDIRFNSSLSNLWRATDDFELKNSQTQGLALTLYYWFDAK
jgi:hypothetical protein